MKVYRWTWVFFVLGGLVNILLNVGLKFLCRIPRPPWQHSSLLLHSLDLEMTVSQAEQVFGMPSGVAQLLTYFLAFFFVSSSGSSYWWGWSCCWVVISLAIIAWCDPNNTWFAWLVGSILGLITGVGTAWMARQQITQRSTQGTQGSLWRNNRQGIFVPE
jgi:hypothetical protein